MGLDRFNFAIRYNDVRFGLVIFGIMLLLFCLTFWNYYQLRDTKKSKYVVRFIIDIFLDFLAVMFIFAFFISQHDVKTHNGYHFWTNLTEEVPDLSWDQWQVIEEDYEKFDDWSTVQKLPAK